MGKIYFNSYVPHRCGHRREPKKYGPRTPICIVRRSVGARRARSEDPNGPPAHTDCPPRPIFSLGRDRAKNSTGRGRTKHCTTWVTSCARFAEAHKAYTGSSPPNVIFKMSVLGHIYLFLEFALCPTLQSSLNILIFCVETSKIYCMATTASPAGSPNKMYH